MKIVKIKVTLNIGLSGCKQEDTIEVEIPDGLTPDEEDELKVESAEEWANNYIDIGYSNIN